MAEFPLKDLISEVDEKRAMHVQLTGSNMEHYGPTVNERPAASAVPIGAIYMAVQTQEIWRSDGTNWWEV